MSETIGYTLGISINATKPKVREAPASREQIEKKSKPKSSKPFTRKEVKVFFYEVFYLVIILIDDIFNRMMQRIKTPKIKIWKEKSFKKKNRKAYCICRDISQIAFM